jgi:HSP20 family protein
MTHVGTIRWAAPFRELDLLRDMTRVASRLSGEGVSAPTWTPPVDLFESAEAVVVDLEIPGIAPDAIDIQLEENVLVVRGERTFEGPGEDSTTRRVERAYGHFARTIKLPTGVRVDDITATFAHGVLRITAPKSPEPRPRKIAVTTAPVEATTTAQ